MSPLGISLSITKTVKIGGVAFAEYPFEPMNILVSGVGASYTVQTPPLVQFGPVSNAKVMVWGNLRANSYLRFTQFHGTGGINTQTIHDTHVVAGGASGSVIDQYPRVGYCYVLAGANDIAPANDPAVVKPKLTRILETLIHNRIIPVVLTIPPSSNATYWPNLLEYNTHLIAEAARLNCPVINIHGTLGDGTGAWTNLAYTSDNIHLTSIGTNTVAPLFATAVPLMRGATVVTPPSADTGNPSQVNTSAWMVDTDLNGIPNNWIASAGGANATSTVEAGTDGVLGNWWKIVKPNDAVDTQYQGGDWAVTVGNRYRVQFRVKIDPTSGYSLSMTFHKAGDTATQATLPAFAWDGDGQGTDDTAGQPLAAQTFCVETQAIPAAMTSMRCFMTLSGTRAATYRLGDFLITDLGAYSAGVVTDSTGANVTDSVSATVTVG